MRVLFSSIDGAGHLNPFLPHARALRDAGDEILFVAPQACAARLAKAGFDHDPGEDVLMDELIEAFAGTERMTTEEKDRVTIPRVFVDLMARRALSTLRDSIARWKPDLIVGETGEFAASVAADEAEIPCVRIAILHGDWERTFARCAGDALDALRRSVGFEPDAGASLRREADFSAFPPAFGDSRIAPDSPVPMRVRMPSEAVEPAVRRRHGALGTARISSTSRSEPTPAAPRASAPCTATLSTPSRICRCASCSRRAAE